MKKCPNCGADIEDSAQRCNLCGTNLQIKDESRQTNPKLMFKDGKWVGKEEDVSQKISNYSEILYVVFAVMGGITIITGFIFMIATAQILMGILIILGGIFQIFIGTVIRTCMEGLSIVVLNSKK